MLDCDDFTLEQCSVENSWCPKCIMYATMFFNLFKLKLAQLASFFSTKFAERIHNLKSG